MPWGEGIPYGPRWGAINQPEAQRLAVVADKPLYLRLHFAALGRANLIGHAEFEPGELAELAARPDGSRPSRQQIANEIRRAVGRGLLAEGSSARCLLLPPPLWDRAGGVGTRSCSWHGERATHSVCRPHAQNAAPSLPQPSASRKGSL